jgi:hypothetical protein
MPAGTDGDVGQTPASSVSTSAIWRSWSTTVARQSSVIASARDQGLTCHRSDWLHAPMCGGLTARSAPCLIGLAKCLSMDLVDLRELDYP